MAGQPPTSIHIPSYLPFPIKITKLLVTPDTTVSRGTAICHYSFEYTLPAEQPLHPDHPPTPARKETRYGTWECPVDGVLQRWLVRPGQVITLQDSAKNPAVMVQEECTHNTQIHGMCALCGKDMTTSDYLGFSDSSRASIRMTHDANGPTVSMEEALRYDRDTSHRLLDDRRLSLIVDLDQTIVHATVDPTVGEWIEDAQRFEAKRNAKATAVVPPSPASRSHTPPTDPDNEEEEEVNPNWDALRDVKRFRLGGEGQSIRSKGKQVVEDGGCYYYIKPRPGLVDFLSRMKSKYEMHVYTMGTRSYALEVCKAIDPDGTVFGERVLTRDESGSVTAKNLQRLFPSDQSMVVVIDDRADVWSDVPNLVKVVPYDFFVGIGDINSAHLPKPPDSVTPPPPIIPATSPEQSSISPSSSASTTPVASPASDVTQSTADDVDIVVAEDSLKQNSRNALALAQSKAIEAVVEERPLAKMQERLDQERPQNNGSGDASPDAASNPGKASEESDRTHVDLTTEKPKTKHKMLLHNNDHELARVENILTEVHRRFYEAYDFGRKENRGRALIKSLDVRTVIQAIKMQTLARLQFTFSNIFPMNIDPRTHPIWRQSQQYGATCHATWTETVTHVIALKLHSEKTDRGERKPGVFVVHPQWLWDSITQWQRLPEEAYEHMLRVLDAAEVRPPPPSASSTNSQLPSQPSPLPLPTVVVHIPEGPPPLGLDSEDSQPIAGPSSLRAPVVQAAAGDDEAEDGGVDPDATNVDWAAIDEEVDAFLNESGDEDVDEYASDSSMRSRDSSASRIRPLKRRRSITPSSESAQEDSGYDVSPLAKRLKASEIRRGQSSLKVELSKQSTEDEDEDKNSPNGSLDDDDDSMDLRAEEEAEDEEGEMQDATDDEEGDDEDDFLARDLADPWG